MPVTSARLADIPRRAFENSSKGLKDFPGASLEGDYERRIKQKSTCGRSWDWICSSLDIFWWLNVLGQRRVLRWPHTNRTVLNRKFQESQMEGQSQIRNLKKISVHPTRLSSFPEITESAVPFVTASFRKLRHTHEFLWIERAPCLYIFLRGFYISTWIVERYWM